MTDNIDISTVLRVIVCLHGLPADYSIVTTEAKFLLWQYLFFPPQNVGIEISGDNKTL